MSAVIKDKKNKLSIPIYLDYSSTTPVDERVAKKMSECLTIEGPFGNPASRSQPYGGDSEKLIDEARQNVADLLNADNILLLLKYHLLDETLLPYLLIVL